MKYVGIVLVLVALLVTGCSAPAASPAPAATSAPAPRPAATAAPAPPAAKAPAAASASGASSPGQGGPTSAPPPLDWDRYIIRTADVALVVKDVEAAVADIQRLTASLGGFTAQSNVRREDTRVLADVVVQVPSEQFERAVTLLRELAVSVDYSRTSSQDVTEEFVDNEARLKNLRASEEATQRMMDKVTKMEDIVVVQRELTSLREQIEKIEGRQRFLQNRAAMSTINLKLVAESSRTPTATPAPTATGTPAPTATATPRPAWLPGRTAGNAWESSLHFLTQVADVLLAIVFFAWWTIPFILGGWWWSRRHRPWERRPKPAAPPPAPQEPPLQGQGTAS